MVERECPGGSSLARFFFLIFLFITILFLMNCTRVSFGGENCFQCCFWETAFVLGLLVFLLR